MTVVTAILEGMFVRGGRKDNFLLFLFGQTLLMITSIVGGLIIINLMIQSSPEISAILGPLGLFKNYAVMTAFALLIWVHEIGHYAQLRRFGVPTFGILMPPLGGVQVPGYILSPAKHIEVALGGPLSGIVALPLLVYGLAFGDAHADLFLLLAFVWAGINLLNLLPIFPMDGGLILVEWLTYWMPRAKAVKVGTLISLLVVAWLVFLIGDWLILAAQLGLVLFLLVVDSGATKLFYWFSRDYLKIEQPPIVPLTKREVVRYAATYMILFALLVGITWLTHVQNPFKFF